MDANLPNQYSILTKVFFLILFVFSAISLIALGFFSANFISNKGSFIVETKPKPTDINNTNSDILEPINQQIGTDVPNGENYFIDTIFAVTNSVPRKALIATVSRKKHEDFYIQSTRISFFDGKNWHRETGSMNIPNSSIYNDALINKWNVLIEESKVLKQSVTGELNLKSGLVKFTASNLNNEVVNRSLPQYTKFFSSTIGTLVVNNNTYNDVKIAYSRIYSTDANEIQVYDDNLKLKTYFLVFWSEDGKTYILDQTNLDPKPESSYKSHSIAFEVEPNGDVVKRVFEFFSSSNEDNTLFNFKLPSKINKTLDIQTQDSFDKFNLGTIWKTGLAEGLITDDLSGKQSTGFGIYEYIDTY